MGAGAAGLIAMKQLLEAGYAVCLLEAAAMAGGRMATVHEAGFSAPVETGAEFIHGDLPLTLSLLQQAHIKYLPVEGKMMAMQNGRLKKNQSHDKHWPLFLRQLKALQTNASIADVLTTYFSAEKYASLRQAVQNYAEGYDLADINKASAMAASREWGNEDGGTYRLPGGYGELVDFLLLQCKRQHGTIHFNSRVVNVQHQPGSVTVSTSKDQVYTGSLLLVTVSAGVLQAGEPVFVPALDDQYRQAIQQLGFGDVIKILLQFRSDFWTSYAADIGFLLSDEPIRTWWTQLPEEKNLLTGWLGGPAATVRSGETERVLLQMALQSLSAIFNLPVQELTAQLLQHKISCWKNHPYVKGGYSYITTGSAAAKEILSHPLHHTIFFAGEACYRGKSQGTVEAALQSGLETANEIKKHLVS